MKKINFFNRHLSQTGENYFEHLMFAFPTAMWIAIVSLALIIHSILPFIFTATASKNIKKINEIMQRRLAVLNERQAKKLAREVEGKVE